LQHRLPFLLKQTPATNVPSSNRPEQGPLFPTIVDEQDYVDDYLTNIPDIVWFVLSREPSPIPSSLPGIDPSLRSKPYVTLPAPPEQAWELRRFLQNERFERPRDFLYRFWACDGFVLCNPRHIRVFLCAFDYLTICDFIPFLRTCLKAFAPHFNIVVLMLAGEMGTRTTEFKVSRR